MDVKLANPRGFCAGVDRAIDIVERALVAFDETIYVRHEVVHNKFVVDDLIAKGVIFVDELKEVPDDSIVIFSAHGVSKAVRQEADSRGLKVFDATCPLVTKVHFEVAKYSRHGQECVLIGHEGHQEVEGTMGQYDHSMGGDMYLVETAADVYALEVANPDKLAFVTQTTLSVDDASEVIDALRDRFPNIQGPRKDDICYATTNRQNAVKELSRDCDLVLVVGSVTSSNSKRLQELAMRAGVESYLIDCYSEIQSSWLEGKHSIGVTAGASAPELLVKQVLDRLGQLGANNVRELDGVEEPITFTVPKELRLVDLPQ